MLSLLCHTQWRVYICEKLKVVDRKRLELGQGDSMDMERIEVQEGGGKGSIYGLQYIVIEMVPLESLALLPIQLPYQLWHSVAVLTQYG